ncbi:MULTISPECIES: ABC transporter permease [Rhizobium/Agrobacterium group]|uniref:ABC transporter membrane spanning protein n=2 Tax=Rhizobium/Agrobacterium group TaxID=227290 RepID=B9K3Y1_ALLAM|nr:MULTISPECIES: ABC transporter permease [Rhizobium/Agrobacterium group]ACM39636.1 ABC transporter membrane spanning protein [Allorhizobium ampelinum S4]ASK49671.1 hypothetical protein [Agrobacterium vitis]MCF1436720.1 ABC transporter permease [Allorhizobium ampelinum]MCF1450302.1 ABC transporter permease [Allorhizobium ampelinum]MCF1495985.1 ABC transporter permease [Allorhizobium ampelinum]
MTHILSRSLLVILFGLLLAPLLPAIVMSFSADNNLAFPPSGWSFRWYSAVLSNERFLAGLKLSVTLAIAATILSLAFGVAASYALVRSKIPFANSLIALFTAPLIVPSIILGLGLLLVFVQLKLNGSYFALVFTHTMIVTPFVIRILVTGLQTMPADIESAAASLGARPLTVFRRITLPTLTPSITGAALLSFLISFDEVAITLFLAGQSLSTLPVAIYRYTTERTDPQIAALSVLLILLSVSLMVLLERVIGLARAIGK